MTPYILHTTLPCQAAITKALLNVGEHPVCTLGLDLELAAPAGAVIIGGGTPLYLGKHPRAVWVSLVQWLVAQGCVVHAAQEACGFGWEFDRRLGAAGACSKVVAPQEMCGKRKTDQRDARALASLLWDYEIKGNKKSLRPVRAPSVEQQQRRGLSRNRTQWLALRGQLEAHGRSLMWDHGWLSVPGGWWRSSQWKQLKDELGKAARQWLIDMLTPMQTTCVQLQQRVDELERQAIEQTALCPATGEQGRSIQAGSEINAADSLKAPAQQTLASLPARDKASAKSKLLREPKAGPKMNEPPLPKGFGQLSYEVVSAEVIDWGRFKNRGQAGSFIGCCPSEHSSGSKQRLGEIDRIGNARLRTVLVEAAWRLLKHNPHWRGFKKFGEVLGAKARAGGARKRKAIVACARLLMIDMWRLHTGTATLEGLGLKAATN